MNLNYTHQFMVAASVRMCVHDGTAVKTAHRPLNKIQLIVGGVGSVHCFKGIAQLGLEPAHLIVSML